MHDQLDQLKTQVAQLIGAELKAYSGKYPRQAISVDWGWTNEVHLNESSDDGRQYVSILIYAGDTKGQGKYLFKPHQAAIVWPATIRDFKLENIPYVKFSHFNSRLFWYHPDHTEYTKIHVHDFFVKTSGRYQRHQWDNLEKTLNEVAPNWIEHCEYQQQIKNSNRTYFDLSFGVRLTLSIPYPDTQILDRKFAQELSALILEMKQLTDS